MGYRLNRLYEPVFMAVPKPMLTEFGIHYRLESCGVFFIRKSSFFTPTLFPLFSRHNSWEIVIWKGCKSPGGQKILTTEYTFQSKIARECLLKWLPLCREPCNYLLGFDLDTLDLWKLGVRGQIVFVYCSSSSVLAKGASCCVPIDQISRPSPKIIVT